MRKIVIDPGLIDSLEVGDAVMYWDRDKSSVIEDGNVVGYIDLNDGKTIHVWLYEEGDDELRHDPSERETELMLALDAALHRLENVEGNLPLAIYDAQVMLAAVRG